MELRLFLHYAIDMLYIDVTLHLSNAEFIVTNCTGGCDDKVDSFSFLSFVSGYMNKLFLNLYALFHSIHCLFNSLCQSSTNDTDDIYFIWKQKIECAKQSENELPVSPFGCDYNPGMVYKHSDNRVIVPVPMK